VATSLLVTISEFVEPFLGPLLIFCPPVGVVLLVSTFLEVLPDPSGFFPLPANSASLTPAPEAAPPVFAAFNASSAVA